MVRRDSWIRPIIALYASASAPYNPHFAASQQYEESREGSPRNHNLEIAVTNSDEYAESVLTISPATSMIGIGLNDYAQITSILSRTRELIDTAYGLIQHERTLKEGQDMMAKANGMFREVKALIRSRATADGDDHRDLLRKKYADHDINRVEEDEQRSLDLTRKMYETMVTFPECVDQLLKDCLAVINSEIGGLGLSTIETVIHQKRNVDQEGYNKVVIITNELADRVKGKNEDGIVEYPFIWQDSINGPRTLGVTGKWDCQFDTPEDCCAKIKQNVPNVDTRGNNIECHIFVPFGGVGNPRRNDRVFITVSPDGRVHEPPIIQ